MASERTSNQRKGTEMRQLNTEQRLARLIELKAQRDEIDREIAVLLGDAPPPRHTRPSARITSSGNSRRARASKDTESAEGTPTEPNGAYSSEEVIRAD
jgi:hypothetical protein